MKTKTKALIIMLIIIILLLLGGVGRGHHKIKGLESTVSLLEENLKTYKEEDLVKYVEVRQELNQLQSNFRVMVEDLYGDGSPEPEQPSRPPDFEYENNEN